MNVLFISLCEKRAINRTRRVIDGYALRTGMGTWTTPITEESLTAIWRALKKTATRQTSVACYRALGKRRMKLMWVVGSRKNFSLNGATPIATKAKKVSSLKIDTRVLLLSRIAGLTHDLGKATALFQAKLAGSLPAQDPVRHEWVSGIILNSMLHSKCSVTEALNQLSWNNGKEVAYSPKFCNKTGLQTLRDVLLFSVVTHHGLPGSTNKDSTSFTTDSYFKGWNHPKHDDNQFKNSPATYFCAGAEFPHRLSDQIYKEVNLLDTDVLSPTLGRALALLNRAFLIMADHTISSRKVKSAAGLVANTRKDDSGKRVMNQPLDYHLENVAAQANKFAYHSFTETWEGLPPYLVDDILASSPDNSPFTWQDRSTHALFKLRETTSSPCLVMNVAGTGAGKTRMNAKAICALNTRNEVRFSTALGLKTLTLQTGDVYSRELGIPGTHLSCIIGDRVAKKLHGTKVEEHQEPNDDENEDETTFDTYSDSPITLPEWLSEYGNITRNADSLLAPPVLVSTIDYLVAAGEPSRQGHHVLAMQRLMNSDLVLDEIDDYSPKSFVAVLRLVEIAAMVGANVVTSSATLPFPMARALGEAFLSGARMHAELNAYPAMPGLAIISNYIDPITLLPSDGQDVESHYQTYIGKTLSVMEAQCLKYAEIAPISSKSETGFLETLLSSIKSLHDKNSWKLNSANKRISFGLVRIANIRTIQTVATYLAKMLPQARIAVYHADDFTIQRHKKERILDTILSRKNGNDAIERSTYIRGLAIEMPTEDVIFVLVASPVEEVGRDHDFDWAVIEPSSVRSIVQTAGRVNRHRKEEQASANIHITQYGMRCCAKGNCESQVHYCRPGFESSDHELESHDMYTLLGEENLNNLTAKLRFTDNIWAKNEDCAIDAVLGQQVKRLTLGSLKKQTTWMSKDFYTKFPLREHNQSSVFVWDKEEWCEEILNESGDPERLNRSACFTVLEPPSNTWLNWTLEELNAYCEQVGIATSLGMRVELDIAQSSGQPNIIFRFGFGFYKG